MNKTMNEISDKALSDFKKDRAVGILWFNAYMEVDDFLFKELKELGEDFPTDSKRGTYNTIEAIKLYADTLIKIHTEKCKK